MVVRQQRCFPTRLIAALVAVALVFAHIVGAYAHAAGHNHAQGPSSCAQQDILSSADSRINAHAQAKHGSEPASHTDAFDFMCNGGLAILAAHTVAFARVKAPHSSRIVEIVHLLLGTSLERPPKFAVRA